MSMVSSCCMLPTPHVVLFSSPHHTQVMEAREEVEGTNDQGQLVDMHKDNKQRQAALCAELSKAFGAGDWELARRLVAQLSYWVRLEEAIAAKL